MSKGFFRSLALPTYTAPVSLIPKCGECGLYQKCKSPKMPPSGKGRKKILILGEAPGATEDQQGIQFVGDSGQLLERTLRKVGIDMRRDCYITNIAICRPPNNKLDERVINYCRPNLIQTIKELQPEIIIPLGASAVKSLIGWLWKEDVKGIGRWVGWQIPSQQLNAWITPTWHPSFLLRSEETKGGTEVLELLFERHLQAAVALEGRPWKVVPDYASKVKILMDVDEAAVKIREFLKAKVIAFDYETTSLKPDGSHAEIVCCSISDGKTTIAYPWHGKTERATKELLLSDVGKVASNMKFEHRFSLAKLGVEVRNWKWDTMIAAHVIDNRKAITSIKFQSFVLLGMPSYDNDVKPYLKSKGSNLPNKVRQASLPKLLLYCGLDSLLEIKVAKIQAKLMGVEL